MNKTDFIITVKYLHSGAGRLKIFHHSGEKLIKRLSAPCAMGRGVTRNKCEGDLMTPLGAFGFCFAFGFEPDLNTKIEYVRLENTMYWVDDIKSEHYNKLVDVRDTAKDFGSAEHMTDYKGFYDYGLVLDYNKECVTNRGSAIFMHCSDDLSRPTHGCIAVDKRIMRKIIKAVTGKSVIAVFD